MIGFARFFNWMKISTTVALLISLGARPSFANHGEDQHREKLEDLFLWKVSDQLKLSSKEETEVSKIYKSLSKKKIENSSQLELLASKLRGRTLQSAEAEAWVLDYEKALAEQAKCQLEEFQKLKKVLGSERLLTYLSIKQQFSERLKELLTK